jgi:hypothetical protein
VAAAIALGLVILIPDRLRWLGLLAGCALVAVVGHGVQVTGWHRLSDVVGSVVLVATLASLAVGGVVALGMTTRAPDGRVDRAVYGLVVAGSLAAIGVGALMLVLLALFPTLGAPVGSRRAFLQAAFPLLGAGGSVLIVTAFARALDGWSIGGRAEESALRPPHADQ